MHEPMNVKYPNNTSKWQMGFNSAFKRLINARLKTGKRGKKTELTGRSPLRRRRSAMDCSATEEEEEKKEEEKEEGRKCTK